MGAAGRGSASVTGSRVVDPRVVALALSATPEVLRVQNGRGSFVTQPWPTGGMPTYPYAVLLANRSGFCTLAFDFDVGVDGVAAVQRDVAELVSLLGPCPHLVARSSRSGGMHVFVLVEEPVAPPAVRRLAVALKAKLPTLDVTPLCNPAAGAIRPPGAPHRDGSQSELLGDAELVNRVLMERASTDQLWWFFRRLGVKHAGSHLPRHLFMALRFGSPHRYRSRSELVAALAASALNRGGEASLSWLGDQLKDGRNHLAASLRNVPRDDGSVRDVDKLIASSFAAARRFVASRPQWNRDTARIELERVASAVAVSRWCGQAGLTDLAVLYALVEIGRRVGSPIVNASERQLAELAACTRATARRSCHRLCAAGWLVLYEGPTSTLASTWKMTVPSSAVVPPAAARFGVDPAPIDDPLFAQRGVGRSAARVWACWRAGVTSTSAIARRTGLHPGTVRRAVARLRRLEARSEWVASCDEVEDRRARRRLAEEVGVWQWWEAVCARHVVERVNYQEFLAAIRHHHGVSPPQAA